jgi:tetratricopeptide (TPR) repeat protein/transcriptional regulator with XRE-family HTH domain
MESTHEKRPLATTLSLPGDHIRWHRSRLHLSQEALADAMGVSTKSIKRWEQNQAIPQPYHREQLCRLLGLDSGLFLEAPEVEKLEPTAVRVPLWNVPFPRNPFFTGRETLLDQLHTLLTTQHAAAPTQAYALSGLGGIGKTQVALEYAYRHTQDYTTIFWVGAETEESLLTDVAAIAALLELPERAEADQNRLLASVTRWLANETGWLLILDNLEEGPLAQRLLPPTWHGAVLLTTRRQALGALAQPLEVDWLPTEEGAHLLLERAGRLGVGQEPLTREEGALARRLAEALGGLPLALDQAGAYLQETGCTLATYLQLYQTAPLRLLDERSVEEPHPASVVRTFGLAYERLAQRHAGAAALVQVAAYLAPEAIPEELLIQGAAQGGPEAAQLMADPFQYQRAFKEVLAYSLLRRQAQAGTATMHRLVQAVMRERLEETSQRAWAERVVRLVAAAFPDPKDYANWERCQRLLPHVLACAGHTKRWDFHFPEAARLLTLAGEYLWRREQYGEALPLSLQAAAIWEQTVGLDHPEVAFGLNNLAITYSLLGRHVEALPLFQRTLALREQALGQDHADTAASLNNLAVTYYERGRYVEALPLLQRALAIREQTLGFDHPSVATTLFMLNKLYFAQGQYEKALPLLQRALAIWGQILGPDHPHMAAGLNDLAKLYFVQGQHHEALPIAQQAMVISDQALGPDCPEIASSLDTLANLARVQGQYGEALSLAQRALAIREQALGAAHPDVAQSLHTLALLSRCMEQDPEALPLYQRALAIWEQALGPDHPDVARGLNNLADLYQALGQHAEALPLFERAVKINEQSLPDHPNTITYLEHLAALLRQMERTEEASTLEERVQAIHVRRKQFS